MSNILNKKNQSSKILSIKKKIRNYIMYNTSNFNKFILHEFAIKHISLIIVYFYVYLELREVLDHPVGQGNRVILGSQQDREILYLLFVPIKDE